MPLHTLAMRPGVDVEMTPTLAGLNQRWAASQWIRFKEGLIQKVGGFEQLISTPLIGTGRGMHAWADLSGNKYCAVGTEQRLELVFGGALFDITPYRYTSTSATFATHSGSATVLVTDTASSAAPADWVYLPGTTTVGGVMLTGFYQIFGTPTSNTYDIAAASAATSNATSSSATVDYLIHTGLASASGSTPLRQWFLDNWGQDLIGNYTQSPIYVWVPPETTGNIAIPINTTTFPGAIDPPSVVNCSFVAMPEQIMVALGCDLPGGNGTQDPNLVRWSDVADFTDWLATSTNQAGSFRLPSGSKIVGGIQTPLFACIWTDVDLWVMQYISVPFVFGFNKVSVGTELISARAATTYQSVVYWMSHDNFYSFNGQAVQVIPCSVWNQVFMNLLSGQNDKIWAWSNHFYNEVWWFYPSANGTGEVDSYIKYNTAENAWDYGSLSRTCGQDENVFGNPLAVEYPSGLIMQHELGYDANGTAIVAFAQTGFMTDQDGTNFTVVKRIAPDILWQIGSVSEIDTESGLPLQTELGDTLLTESSVNAMETLNITVVTQDYTTDTQYAYGPFPITPTTPYCVPRARGRTFAVNFQSSGLGVFWRLGANRLETGFAGKR